MLTFIVQHTLESRLSLNLQMCLIYWLHFTNKLNYVVTCIVINIKDDIIHIPSENELANKHSKRYRPVNNAYECANALDVCTLRAKSLVSFKFSKFI